MRALLISLTDTPEVPGIVTVKASTAADGTDRGRRSEYCISAQDSGQWSHVSGPGGNVKTNESSDACTAWTSGVS